LLEQSLLDQSLLEQSLLEQSLLEQSSLEQNLGGERAGKKARNTVPRLLMADVDTDTM
jgi:hypothetical protein